jgi:hypothetical protein
MLPRAGPQQVDRTQAQALRRHTAARGQRGGTHTGYSKKKVYQDGATSGMERVCQAVLLNRLIARPGGKQARAQA